MIEFHKPVTITKYEGKADVDEFGMATVPEGTLIEIDDVLWIVTAAPTSNDQKILDLLRAYLEAPPMEAVELYYKLAEFCALLGWKVWKDDETS